MHYHLGFLLTVATCVALLQAASAHAQNDATLIELINAYRAAPGRCEGKQAHPAKPLTPHTALARVPIASRTILQSELEKADYAAEYAEGIYISGASDAASVMATIRTTQCRTLLNAQLTSVGTVHRGNDWLIILARPLQALQLPPWQDAGKVIVESVNAARAAARSCGNEQFAAALPVIWNERLGEAALAHSRDMAANNYFSHEAKDGSQAGDRAKRVGYDWRRIGENIASGIRSPQEAMAGWLSSPGHCANIMDPRYTEMGAAYAITQNGRSAYWTQVFATPRASGKR